MTLHLIGIIGLLVLGLPGWQLARAARLPCPLLVGLLAGSAALVTLVLAAQLSGLRLNVFTIGPAWMLWLVASLLWARSITARSVGQPPREPAPSTFRFTDLWPWLIALPAIAGVIYRTLQNPLFGWDTKMRWGSLAEQMWLRETLAFYPPVSAADFGIYFWPDGIPPLVSSSYFGLFSFAGSMRAELTSAVTIAQFVLLLGATGSLARRLFSPAAGGWAVALLGVTPLAAWATSMGQETGFTALALVGLLLYLPRTAAEETRAAMLTAGLAAAVGSLAREYGWVFFALGLGLGCWRGLSRKGLGWYCGVVALTALPWYARNFALTGNPVFNLSISGLFPVNEAHTALMEVFRLHFTVMKQYHNWPLATLFGCAAVTVTAVASIVRFRRRTIAPALAIGIVAFLWITSVPYTAGGIAYSMRVLNPALAIAAALGGAALAAGLAAPRRRTAGVVVLAALGICSVPHTLVLPLTPKEPTAEAWIHTWFTGDGSAAVVEKLRYDGLRVVARHVGNGRVLALGYNPELTHLGVASAPPWSPDASFLFDRSIPPPTVWQRLKANRFTHVIIFKSPLNRSYLIDSPAFADASTQTLIPVMDNQGFMLFAIGASAPAVSTAPAQGR